MPSNLQYALYGILALLVVGTVVIGLKRMFKPGSGAPELWLRMRSWWVMAGLFIMAIAVNRTLSIVFFALVSFLALKEYFSIIPTRRADRRGLFWAYLAIPLQYFWVAEAWFGMFIIFIPVYLFLFIPLKMVIVGETQGFLKAAGTLHWGLMTAVFSLSHAAFLLALPDAVNPAAGSAGLLLFFANFPALSESAGISHRVLTVVPLLVLVWHAWRRSNDDPEFAGKLAARLYSWAG